MDLSVLSHLKQTFTPRDHSEYKTKFNGWHDDIIFYKIIFVRHNITHNGVCTGLEYNRRYNTVNVSIIGELIFYSERKQYMYSDTLYTLFRVLRVK